MALYCSELRQFFFAPGVHSEDRGAIKRYEYDASEYSRSVVTSYRFDSASLFIRIHSKVIQNEKKIVSLKMAK